MKKLMELSIFLVLLWLGVYMVSARGSALKHMPEKPSLMHVMQDLTGSKTPIWHLYLTSHHSPRKPTVTVFRSIEVVLVPFRSSAEFCRAYAIFMQAPNESVDSNKGYGLGSSLYAALDKGEEACDALSFREDYFSVNREATDATIHSALQVLKNVLSDWNGEHSNNDCGGGPLTISQLQSIKAEPDPPGFVNVQYWLRCGSDSISTKRWRTFNVWFDSDDSFKKYRSHLAEN